MSRFHLRVLAFATATLLAVVPPASRAADPFEINAILSETGAAAFLGKEEARSLGVVEDLVNRMGGINRRPVKIVIHDDQSNPQVAVQLLNDVMAKGATVVLGSSIAAVCNAMGALVKTGPVQYCLSPGIHPTDGGYVFSVSISTADLLSAAAKYFAARGWNKIAIITSNDATGQDAERGIDAAFNAAGGETIVSREHFNTTDISVAAQMAQIKASGAQAIIAWSSGTPIATIFRGINESGIALPILTTSANATYAQMKAYADFLPKELYFSVPPAMAPDQLPNGPVKRAVNIYLDAFKNIGIRPDSSQALAWDASLIVIDAYRKLGTNATSAQIRDYIAGLRGWPGAAGSYDFRAIPQRGVGTTNAVVARWDRAKDTWSAVSRLGGEPLR